MADGTEILLVFCDKLRYMLPRDAEGQANLWKELDPSVIRPQSVHALDFDDAALILSFAWHVAMDEERCDDALKLAEIHVSHPGYGHGDFMFRALGRAMLGSALLHVGRELEALEIYRELLKDRRRTVRTVVLYRFWDSAKLFCHGQRMQPVSEPVRKLVVDLVSRLIAGRRSRKEAVEMAQQAHSYAELRAVFVQAMETKFREV